LRSPRGTKGRSLRGPDLLSLRGVNLFSLRGLGGRSLRSPRCGRSRPPREFFGPPPERLPGFLGGLLMVRVLSRVTLNGNFCGDESRAIVVLRVT
jgi:hypothetical protein